MRQPTSRNKDYAWIIIIIQGNFKTGKGKKIQNILSTLDMAACRVFMNKIITVLNLIQCMDTK